MLIQPYDLLVKNLPYKKMPGYLKSIKINPDAIAISITDDGKKYVPIDWKNYLPHGHKVVKIILCKKYNLFLLVGYSKDGESIIYNDGFSKHLLHGESNIVGKTNICNDHSSNHKYKFQRLDILLDKIGHSDSGISSLSNLTNEEKKELIELSKK
ncbi:hypothetical protein G6N05_14095 [Flavobacterium sp. F372]|uniref:Uncharacterized protein n=1 Tax=Flavobacterium bernardetii TaxID=2813823 RepID=A0ABR7J250_9FLAO|nr:hypothetical protein [Flavobacterium bernardetii]MBC5836018.1 hypothetical protein [Flavobacterium bernardetii]NHF71242.1 hypothetical protein [Flavobacterium bernardetii]